MRDSVGIEIVENAQDVWKGVAIWTLETNPVVEIGANESDPRHQLFQPGDVVRLDAGQIVLVNGDGREVLMFDSLGNFVRQLGRYGEGPGEYRYVRALHRCGADTVIVNDQHRRLLVFDNAGRVVRTHTIAPLPGDGFLRVQGVAGDCGTVLFRSFREHLPTPGELVQLPFTLFWSDLQGPDRDTVGIFSQHEQVRRGMDLIRLPWGRDTRIALATNRLYVAGTGAREVRVFAPPRDLVRIIRWMAAPDPVTSTEREAHAESRAYWLGQYPHLEQILLPLDAFPTVPQERPAFHSLLADTDGTLWVRRYPETVAGLPDIYDYANHRAPLRHRPQPDDAPEVWAVFDSTGQYLGTVRVPAMIAVREIHGGYVIGVWKDSSDVERVRLYRLRAETQNTRNPSGSMR